MRTKLGISEYIFQAVHGMDLGQLHFLLALVMLSWQTRYLMKIIHDLSE